MRSPSPHAAHLPLYLAAAYTLLVIYASLHPFLGWKDGGVPLLAFLSAPWPRYWTVFDLVVNMLAYLPLGFLWVPALQVRIGRLPAFVSAVLMACVLSLGLESIQNFLPSRVSSNLDLATNGLGVLLGALAGARWGVTLLDGGRLHAWIRKLIGDGAVPHAGMILLALWLLTQLNPEILLFGNGDLRGVLAVLGVPEALPYTAEGFPWVEAGVTASNTLAIGLLCSCLLRHGQHLFVLILLTSALAMKSFTMLLLINTDGFAWATTGSMAGFAVGVLLWLVASFLPYALRQAIAALALMMATILVNLAPENPYLAAMRQLWQQGHFLNFNGLTRLTSSLWPFLALPWLMLLRQDTRGK